ncbi:MAG: GldG family protein [Verrucomicrobia bacterium]|nr:GldG family protein [Verrucomicrobiota bacterium]
MMKSRNLETLIYSAVGIAAVFVILVAINILADFMNGRLDMTEGNIYTLSEGTREILEDIDAPLTVRFYYSHGDEFEASNLQTYAKRVEDLLAEYEQACDYIKIEKLNPLPATDAEDSANLDGMRPVMENGQKRYLGLAVVFLDSKETIPMLSPSRDRLLEYDISSAISRVLNPKKPVIGVMSALPVFGTQSPMAMQTGQAQQQPWIFIREFEKDFEVRDIPMSTEEISDDINALLVVHPRDISEQGQFAIDQYLLKGGKVIAFLDPASLIDPGSQGMNRMQRAMSTGSTMDKLLDAWGIEFDPDKVVADMNYKTKVSSGGGPNQSNPAVLSINKDAVNTTDLVTSKLDNVLMLFAGVFRGEPKEGITKTTLIETSENSQLVQKMMAQFSGSQIMQEFEASGVRYPLAVRLSGKFKTAFPEGKPEPENASEQADGGEAENTGAPAEPEDYLKEAQSGGVVVLVGDSDMIFDRFCMEEQRILGMSMYRPMNQNLVFAQNVTEQMAGDPRLIGLKSRATMNRPFTVINEIKAKAEMKYQSKISQLQEDLRETQNKLNQLQQAKQPDQQQFLTQEQQQTIQQFREREVEISRELREVQKELRSEIVALENRLKWINIAGMPALITILGIVLALIKRKRTGAK